MSETVGKDPLAALLEDLDEASALSMARERLEGGEDPVSIMEACQKGMLRVGLRYEQGEYYLSGLIMAGAILREVVELLKPALEGRAVGGRAGRVLLGTVQGDIHDIGKNMVGMLLQCNGFTVHDIGVDAPPQEFLAQAAAVQPHVVGMSGLLTVAYDAMRDTIRALRESSDPSVSGVPVIIGGSLVDERVARMVGADHWANDAMTGMRLCRRLCTPSATAEP